MQDNLDNLIDGALAGYSSAEPLAGLEERVLERVRLEQAARRRKRAWWMAALAIPEVAAILFAVLAHKPAPKVVPVAQVTPAPVVLPVTREVVKTAVVKRPVAAPRPKPRELPKRDQFPTPTPLSREERLLVAMAESHPAVLQFAPVGEIEIKPIVIAPLIIDGGQ